MHREGTSRCNPRPSARRVRDTDAGGNRMKRRLFALALALLLAVSLPVSALHLIAASVELNRNANTLAAILADGVVDSTEMDQWRAVLRLVNDQLAACIQILEAGANQK